MAFSPRKNKPLLENNTSETKQVNKNRQKKKKKKKANNNKHALKQMNKRDRRKQQYRGTDDVHSL